MTESTKALIFKDNLRHNIKSIKNHIGQNVKMCVAVKADGYGHGSFITSKIALEEGADFLAVARVEEGIELRKKGIDARILLLSLCNPSLFQKIFEYEITPFVFGKDHIKNLSKAADEYFKNSEKKFGVHLAVDTGMGRIGCFPEVAGTEAELINNSNHLFLEGMGTHFAVSDSLSSDNISYTQKQFDAFKTAVENVKSFGINPGICHAGASAVILNNPGFHLDMVRPGIITYGYYPDEITKNFLLQKGIDLNLKPVMQFETEVSAIRHFKKGMSVSYGRTWTCTEDTDIAVLPVGYADGLLRRFSPGLKVAINKKEYPVVGRICMDQCMVNIGKGNTDVHVWDKAVIFGPVENGEATQDADTLAALGKTISYEVLTSVGKRVPRIEI